MASAGGGNEDRRGVALELIMPPARLALTYVALGLAWIALSDLAVSAIGLEGRSARLAQSVKGAGYVIATGVMLWWLLRRGVRHVQRTSAQYHDLFEMAGDAIVVFEPENETVLDVNQRACELYGVPREKFVGMSMKDVSTDVGRGREYVERVMSNAATLGFETVQRRADGTAMTLRINSAPVQFDGRPAILSINRDVTVERRAEQALAQSEERYRLLFQNAPVGLFVNKGGWIISANAEATRIFKANAPEDLIGTLAMDRIHPDLHEVVRERIRVLGEQRGNVPPLEERLLCLDGSEVAAEVSATACVVGGEPAIQVVVRDITERKRFEVELLESRARFAGIIESAMDAVISVDSDQRVVVFNAAAERMFRCCAEEAVGASIERFIPAHARRAHAGHVRRFGEGGATTRRMGALGAISGVRSDGEEFPIEASISKTVAGGQTFFTVILRDITERCAAERRQAFMMQELDHRVKNNLAAVLSIADSTIQMSETIGDFRDAFVGRIWALSRMHSLLAHSRWEGVRLGQLVSQTLEAYSRGDSGRVTVEGEDFTLPPAAAGPLCMALHELATNAAKYGALAAPAGRVAVAWRRGSGDAGGPCLELSWMESGGSPVVPPKRRGFGSTLIEEIISYELGGRVSLRFPERGAMCDIVIPLSRASNDDSETARNGAHGATMRPEHEHGRPIA